MTQQNFFLGEDQRIFRESLARWLGQHWSLLERRRLAATDPGYSREAWAGLAEVLLAQGEPLAALRLSSAATALTVAAGAVLRAEVQARLDGVQAAARQALSPQEQAAAWAAERIESEELDMLRELAADVVARSGDDSIGEANWQFHQKIHRAAHSPRGDRYP